MLSSARRGDIKWGQRSPYGEAVQAILLRTKGLEERQVYSAPTNATIKVVLLMRKTVFAVLAALLVAAVANILSTRPQPVDYTELLT